MSLRLDYKILWKIRTQYPDHKRFCNKGTTFRYKAITVQPQC